MFHESKYKIESLMVRPSIIIVLIFTVNNETESLVLESNLIKKNSS